MSDTWSVPTGYYIFTDEMIKAAVEWANTFGVHSMTSIERWKGLNKLYIFRCEGCDGSGYDDPDFHDILGECPDCNGKGYTVGVKDDRQ